jgi:hypothetical protein
VAATVVLDRNNPLREIPYLVTESELAFYRIPKTLSTVTNGDRQNTVAIGNSVAGMYSIAINGTSAEDTVAIAGAANIQGSIAIKGTADAANAVAIGGWVGTGAYDGVAVGASAFASGAGSVAIGGNAYAGPGEWSISRQELYSPFGAAYYSRVFETRQQRLHHVTEGATPTRIYNGDPNEGNPNVANGFFVQGQLLRGRVYATAEGDHYAEWEFEYVTQPKVGPFGPPVAHMSGWIRRIGGSNTSGGRALKAEVVLYEDPPFNMWGIEVTGLGSTDVQWWAIVDEERFGDTGERAAPIPEGISRVCPGFLQLPASEALVGGRLVNIWNDGGTAKVRYADASSGRPADGFVLQDTASTAMAGVYLLGENPFLSGMTVGRQYLGEDGQVTATVPASNLHQEVGFAASATTLVFQRGLPINL